MIPIHFSWLKIDTVRDDGELVERLVMVPLDRFENLCIKQFVVGERYRMEVIEERSAASHKQYFAAIREAWKQLPEKMAPEYPTPEALRKRCLIKLGYHHEQSIVLESPQQAARMASFMKPLFDFDVVVVKGNVIKHYRALSQSYSEMDKKTFQESKDRVLELLSDTIGVKKSELKQAGERPPA